MAAVVVVYSATGSRPMIIAIQKIIKVNNKHYNNTRLVHTRVQQFAPLMK